MRRLWPAALAAALVVVLSGAVCAPARDPLPAGAAAASSDTTAVLIEMGWGQPDTRFLRTHIAEMLRTPFDGSVVRVLYPIGDTMRNFSWDLWGRRRFTMDDLRPALDDLRATPLGRFRHSLIRVNVTPGDLDWFEDHSAVWANLELAARLAREGGLAGVLFDTEAYQGQLWDYRAQTRGRRRSWEEVADRARRAGREAMAALQRGYPDLLVFTMFAYSTCLRETAGGRRPLRDSRYGLLAPFLDGMLDTAEGRTILVDAQEGLFDARDPARFAAGADSVRRGALRIVGADPARYRRFVRVGYDVWLDYDWERNGWDAERPARNYFTPAVFDTMLRAALAYGDGYVLVYSQKPRWWTERGGSANVSAEYDSALRRVRRAMRLTPLR